MELNKTTKPVPVFGDREILREMNQANRVMELEPDFEPFTRCPNCRRPAHCSLGLHDELPQIKVCKCGNRVVFFCDTRNPMSDEIFYLWVSKYGAWRPWWQDEDQFINALVDKYLYS